MVKRILVGILTVYWLIAFGYSMGLAKINQQLWEYRDPESALLWSFLATGGHISGNATYYITSYKGTSGIESELEFPLNNSLLGIEGSLHYRNPNNGQDEAKLIIGWYTNISDYAGKLKDSDWLSNDLDIVLTGSAHSGKDIYSESDAELRANIIDVRYVYNFYSTKNLDIGSVIGYKYQKFEYNASNVDQIGYGPYVSYQTVSVLGPVLDYEVEHSIPYLGLSAEVLSGNRFRLNVRAVYSPRTWAHDRDDHLLRYKLSKGDCEGNAYFITMNANWKFSSNWLLQIGGEYTGINTEGTQYQEFYAGSHVGESYTVEDKISSSLLVSFVGFEYRF